MVIKAVFLTTGTIDDKKKKGVIKLLGYLPLQHTGPIKHRSHFRELAEERDL